VRQAKRLVKIVVGFTLLLLGAVLLFTPGPGWPVVFAGLVLLAAEFIWARRLLDHLKSQVDRVRTSLRPSNNSEKA
jgi:uncharacterized protein (TIGR02611 family)